MMDDKREDDFTAINQEDEKTLRLLLEELIDMTDMTDVSDMPDDDIAESIADDILRLFEATQAQRDEARRMRNFHTDVCEALGVDPSGTEAALAKIAELRREAGR